MFSQDMAGLRVRMYLSRKSTALTYHHHLTLYQQQNHNHNREDGRVGIVTRAWAHEVCPLNFFYFYFLTFNRRIPLLSPPVSMPAGGDTPAPLVHVRLSNPSRGGIPLLSRSHLFRWRQQEGICPSCPPSFASLSATTVAIPLICICFKGASRRGHPSCLPFRICSNDTSRRGCLPRSCPFQQSLQEVPCCPSFVSISTTSGGDIPLAPSFMSVSMKPAGGPPRQFPSSSVLTVKSPPVPSFASISTTPVGVEYPSPDNICFNASRRGYPSVLKG